MEPSTRKDAKGSGSDRPCQLPPPPASWPAAAAAVNRGDSKCPQRPAQQVASKVPSWSGFDEDFEVHLPGRGDTSFFVRVAGRELAATNGVAVVIHGGGFTGMSWAPAAGLMKRDCCVLAPDLRGHGLTSSDDTATRNVDRGDDDDSEGDGEDGAMGGADSPMSLESLVEDVASLLVEIFARGLLSWPRQRQDQQPPLHAAPVPPQTAASPPVADGKVISSTTPATSNSISSIDNRGLTSGSAKTVEPNPRPPRDSEEPEEERGGGDNSSCDTSHASGVRDCSSPATSPEVLPANPIKLLLVGHSLGGSIAVRVAGAADELKRRCRGGVEVAGLVAVDVVEGTALASLDDMPEILRKIPRSFSSVEDAVLWHIKTGAVRNAASAHAVVPSRLKEDGEGKKVVWRTDLRATERCWRGWFEGMSAAFLELSMPKLLVVAGMDRLDTELTAAHMQGRFQLKLVYGCGHSVQEDQPGETAASIINFAIRNSIVPRGASDGGGRAGEEEELRLKLARARGQANHTRR